MSESPSELLDRLLDEPTESAAALQHRVRDVDTAELRTRLIERLLSGQMPGRRLENALDLLTVVGLDEFSHRRLFDVATSPEADAGVRQLAAMALMMDPDVDPMELAEQFGPQHIDDLMAANISILMQHAEHNPAVATELAEQLLEIPGGEREAMFQAIDDTRRRLGLEAGLVYGALLEDTRYEPLWPLIASAALDDDIAGDAPVLEDAASRADDPPVQRHLRQVAMQLRTREIDGHDESEDEPVEGFGLLGSCDGSGGFPVLVIRRRDEETLDVVNLLFRTSGEFRDAFVFQVESPEVLDEMTERMTEQAGARFVKLPLETIAAIAQKRMDLAREHHDELPPEFARAGRYVWRLDAGDDALPDVTPTDEGLIVTELRPHFAQDMYRHWYLDRATVVQAGIDKLESMPEDPDQLQQITAQVAQIDEVVEQSASLAEHMALWHALKGDQSEAQMLARLAEITRADPEHSPLLTIRVEMTLTEWMRLAEDADFPIEWIEDRGLRRHLRQLFFADVDPPTGEDVLHLTLTSVAFIALDWALEYVPAGRHPRPEQRHRLAYESAARVTRHLLEPDQPEPLRLHEAVTDVLTESTLDPDDARQVAAWILADTQQYVDDYAPPAFYQALAGPDHPMPDAFFD